MTEQPTSRTEVDGAGGQGSPSDAAESGTPRSDDEGGVLADAGRGDAEAEKASSTAVASPPVDECFPVPMGGPPCDTRISALVPVVLSVESWRASVTPRWPTTSSATTSPRSLPATPFRETRRDSAPGRSRFSATTPGEPRCIPVPADLSGPFRSPSCGGTGTDPDTMRTNQIDQTRPVRLRESGSRRSECVERQS